VIGMRKVKSLLNNKKSIARYACLFFLCLFCI